MLGKAIGGIFVLGLLGAVVGNQDAPSKSHVSRDKPVPKELDLGAFDEVVAAFDGQLKECRSRKITLADAYLGKLYGCIAGKAETAKFFINEISGTDRAKNIKVIWNAWREDMGYGAYADYDEARSMVHLVADRYAPAQRMKIAAAFNGTRNTVFHTPEVRIVYTAHAGPNIDEHMIVVWPK